MPPAHPDPDEVRQGYREVAADAEVRTAEHATMFENAVVGVAFVSKDGVFLRVNQRYCDLVGYSQWELQFRRKYQDLTHPDDLVASEAQAMGLAAGDQASYRLQKRYIHKQGYAIWVDLVVNAIRNATDGTFVHYLAQAQEVRMPDSSIRVSKDASGRSILVPVVGVQEFVTRNWKTLTLTVVPAALAVLTATGTTARNYYVTAAELEANRSVLVQQKETIVEQKKELEELRQEVKEINRGVKALAPKPK